MGKLLMSSSCSITLRGHALHYWRSPGVLSHGDTPGSLGGRAAVSSVPGTSPLWASGEWSSDGQCVGHPAYVWQWFWMRLDSRLAWAIHRLPSALRLVLSGQPRGMASTPRGPPDTSFLPVPRAGSTHLRPQEILSCCLSQSWPSADPSSHPLVLLGKGQPAITLHKPF